ncbi:MAG TPA: DUF6325 family protein [Dongiaceae bacterium]|jgi:hypothetical protein
MSTTSASETSQADVVDTLDDMGPIDFVVIEFPHRKQAGSGLPLFVNLVDRGIIRILDLAFVRKEPDGNIRRMELSELGPELAVFAGASSGLLVQEDLVNAAMAVEPDSTAALLIYENRWLAPLATELRRNGAQLVASERLPVQAILAALDATEPN